MPEDTYETPAEEPLSPEDEVFVALVGEAVVKVVNRGGTLSARAIARALSRLSE